MQKVREKTIPTTLHENVIPRIMGWVGRVKKNVLTNITAQVIVV